MTRPDQTSLSGPDEEEGGKDAPKEEVDSDCTGPVVFGLAGQEFFGVVLRREHAVEPLFAVENRGPCRNGLGKAGENFLIIIFGLVPAFLCLPRPKYKCFRS